MGRRLPACGHRCKGARLSRPLPLPGRHPGEHILACDAGQVTFRYRNAKTRKSECRTVSGVEFLRLLLAHVLPKGLRRARNFGFLHANSKKRIALLQILTRRIPDPAPIRHRPALCCPCCGTPMIIVRTKIPPAGPPSPPVGVNRAGVVLM